MKNNNKNHKTIKNKKSESKLLSLYKIANKCFITACAAILTAQFALAKEAAKTEHSVVFQKFGIAIALVIFFAVALYLVLFAYKKYFLNAHLQNEIGQNEISLETPTDTASAVATFLERTRSEK